MDVFYEAWSTGKIESDEAVLRFMTAHVPPHIKVIRDATGFTASGPHYSLIAEAARYINYR